MMPRELEEKLVSLSRRAATAGAAALGLALAAAIVAPEAFFRACLIGFLLASGVALGSLAVLALHHVVGGEWGFVSRRTLEAASRTILWLPLFFLPVLAGAGRLYPWWTPEVSSELVAHKAPYLNPPFFLLRAALYFAVWIGLAWQLNKWSRDQDRGERAWVNRLQALGASGLLLYGLTVTFASIDWVMSLEPEWFSTIYGLVFMVGQVLSALAFSVLVLRFLSRYQPLKARLEPSHFHDLGNLVLAFVLLWAYMAFSQYLIIWSGNLPEEIPWYLSRSRGGWAAMSLVLVVLHFTLPFFVLLSRRTKRSADVLARVVAVVLVARFLDLFWLVTPASREVFGVHLLDLLAPIGLFLLWLALFFRELAKLPPLPLHDPRFESESASPEALQHGAG